jgi:hypothetical protein
VILDFFMIGFPGFYKIACGEWQIYPAFPDGSNPEIPNFALNFKNKTEPPPEQFEWEVPSDK